MIARRTVDYNRGTSFAELELQSFAERNDGETVAVPLTTEEENALALKARLREEARRKQKELNELTRRELSIFTGVYVVFMTLLLIMFECFKPVLRETPTVLDD